MTLIRKFLIFAALALTLAGCKSEIYANLSEREANEILNVLLSEGISARKTAIGDGLFAVEVPDGDLQASLSILDEQGLPKGARDSIGQVFAKSGIVSSPFEERIRYIYALGEEVGNTIQQIDGVMVARVHLVMPEAPELGQDLQPSQASVFIKQKPGYDLDFLMPQVRRLVANAIEGLSYEQVAVVLVEAAKGNMTPSARGVDMVEVLPGLRVEASGADRVWLYLAGSAGVALVLILGAGWLAWMLRTTRRQVTELRTEIAG